MTRTLGLLAVGVLATTFSAPAAEPLSPILASTVVVDKATTVAGLLADVEKQSGVKVTSGAADRTISLNSLGKKGFWDALEAVAAKTDTHLEINSAGKGITFAAGRSATAASVEGPFRVSCRSVAAKADGGTGRTSYTVALDVHWEPRFPVFRIDAQPRVTQAKDDLGTTLTVRETAVKAAVTGYAHTAEFRVEGLTRKATTIANLAGEFNLTASPRMLAFAFDDLTTLPVSKEQEGVKATVGKLVKREDVWEVQVSFVYRDPPPPFESFESWTNRNTFALVPPSKAGTIEVVNYDIATNERTVTAAYRVSRKTADLGDRKGWNVTCETPAPLVEFPIKFHLQDVKLP